MRVPLSVQTYESRSLPFAAQRLINLYPEAGPQNAASHVALFGTPGVTPFQNIGDGPIRGQTPFQGSLYVVSGEQIFVVGDGLTPLLSGNVPGDGPVVMAASDSQVVTVTNNRAYVTEAGSTQEITDPNFRRPAWVTWLDQYFIFVEISSGRFFLAPVGNALGPYDALQFATAESSPDNLVACVAVNRQLWLIGTETIEIWYNSGASPFPFERTPGGVIEIGCTAPHSIAELPSSNPGQSAIFWLAPDGVVYQNGERISQHGMEHRIRQYTLAERNEAEGFTYEQEGHRFYILSFARGSWAYDLITGVWHERLSYGFQRWNYRYGRGLSQKVIVAGLGNDLYELDLEAEDDAGEEIVRHVACPVIHAEGRQMFMHAVELEMNTGNGPVTGPVDVMLDWSDDGGRTWSSIHKRSPGNLGDYIKRAVWRRLGNFRRRILRFTISERMPIGIHAVNVGVGNE